LNDLKDPVGIKIYSELKNKNGDLRKVLTVRNGSILAHGFVPIKKESLKKLFQIVENHLKEIVKNFDIVQQSLEFPKLKF